MVPFNCYCYYHCLLLGIIAGAAAAAGGEKNGAAVVIATRDMGKVAGVGYERHDEFLGIPYAEAPVGDMRWRPPALYERKGDVRDEPFNATAYRLPCPQSGVSANASSEDCLFLNVFTPKRDRRAAGLLPVMVWIHGGCFVEGSPYDSNFNGSSISSHSSVIVVTIAYRLGALGFLGGNDLLRLRCPDFSAGNYGVQDQRKSLEWIQRNIFSFGGNASRVFVWGQSAGAASVAFHLAASRSWGLFSKVGMESGAFGNWNAYSWEAAKKNYDRFLKASPCKNATNRNSLQCLLSLPAQNIVAAAAFGGATDAPCRDGCSWEPTVDGVELLDYPWRMISRHRPKGVDLLLGSNLDDGKDFVDDVANISADASASQFKTYVSTVYGQKFYSGIRALYHDSSHVSAAGFSQSYWEADRIETDFAYACPNLRTSNAFSGTRVFLYQWAYHGPASDAATFVLHGSEIPYVFNNTAGFNAEQVAVAARMSQYFVDFAKNGYPSNGEWKPYTEQFPGTFVISNISKMVLHLREKECAYWNKTWDFFGRCVPLPSRN